MTQSPPNEAPHGGGRFCRLPPRDGHFRSPETKSSSRNHRNLHRRQTSAPRGAFLLFSNRLVDPGHLAPDLDTQTIARLRIPPQRHLSQKLAQQRVRRHHLIAARQQVLQPSDRLEQHLLAPVRDTALDAEENEGEGRLVFFDGTNNVETTESAPFELGDGNDILVDDLSDNAVDGGAGDDVFVMAGGNDTIRGGDGGHDVAFFDGSINDYAFTVREDGDVTVYHPYAKDGDSYRGVNTFGSVERFAFQDLHARDEIGRWRNHYNTERPHSALRYLSPTEFLTTIAATTLETLAVSVLSFNTANRPKITGSTRP
ncbi:Integrase core domain-containing protein [Roseivivax sediminis]|uniref:Integrase core domain-containing protein n=1 Tax=Roseivivax sediminis TaxID=936889 RepID=A0A1I2DZ85_9RHOB|nr:Integrase core domain-containing protein [Roseivivax sediminis]